MHRTFDVGLKRKSCFASLWLVLIAAAVLISSCAKKEAPTLGRQAPDFAGEDLAGKKISLSDYRGKIVLVDFWATWCSGCIAELPNVKRVYDTYKDKGFNVVGINLNQKPEDLELFLRMINIDWPQIYDGRGQIATVYEVNSIPATFLIDENGVIRYTNLRGGAELDQAVRDLLNLPATPVPAGVGSSSSP